MKKIRIIAVLLLAAAVVGLSGCKDPVTSTSSPPQYSVTVSLQDAKIGEAVRAKPPVAKAGVTVTLTANLGSKRYVNLSADGVTIAPILTDGGTATFKMPAKDITVKAVFADVAYIKVPYADLENYLKNTATTTGVNYIELTGTIPPADLKGGSTLFFPPSKLGKLLEKYRKKRVALKLPSNVPGLTDMSYAFLDCTNLIAATIPANVTRAYA